MLPLMQRLGESVTVQAVTEKREPLPEPSPLQSPEKTRTMLTIRTSFLRELPRVLYRPRESWSNPDRPAAQRPHHGRRLHTDTCGTAGAHRSKPGGVLLQITGVHSVSHAAISLYSEAAAVTAFAVLGCTPVDRVIAAPFCDWRRRYAPPNTSRTQKEPSSGSKAPGDLDKLHDLDRTSAPGR